MADSPRVDELRRRVQADPASIAFAALAEELRRAHHLQEAVEVARTGLARHPAYASARVTLGRALVELGEVGEARVQLERALASAPENLAALRSLAELHRHAGELSRARELARRGATLFPQDRELRALLEALGPDPAASPQVAAAPVRVTTERPGPPPEPPLSTPEAPPTSPPASAPEPVQTSPAPPPGLDRLERWLDALVRDRLRREAVTQLHD